jgi:hypothetical protein
MHLGNRLFEPDGWISVEGEVARIAEIQALDFPLCLMSLIRVQSAIEGRI